MAFKLPTFNLWGRAWEPQGHSTDIADATWIYRGHFRAQMRLTEEHWADAFCVEVPKHLGFRPYSQTPHYLGFRIQLAGWEYHWAVVSDVTDVAPGFPNEHRTLQCHWPWDTSWWGQDGLLVPAVNPTLGEPEDSFPMPTYPPVDFWQDPSMDTYAWKSQQGISTHPG